MNTQTDQLPLPAIAEAKTDSAQELGVTPCSAVFPKFRFYEYNSRRKARGAEAVRIEVQQRAIGTKEAKRLLNAEFYPMKRGELKPDDAMRYVEKKMSA